MHLTLRMASRLNTNGHARRIIIIYALVLFGAWKKKYNIRWGERMVMMRSIFFLFSSCVYRFLENVKSAFFWLTKHNHDTFRSFYTIIEWNCVYVCVCLRSQWYIAEGLVNSFRSCFLCSTNCVIWCKFQVRYMHSGFCNVVWDHLAAPIFFLHSLIWVYLRHKFILKKLAKMGQLWKQQETVSLSYKIFFLGFM